MSFYCQIYRRFLACDYAPRPFTLYSAILVNLAFPPWGVWPLVCVGLVPWLLQLRRSLSLQQVIGQGMWLGYLVSLGGFYWIGFALKDYGHLPGFVSALGVSLFCCVAELQFVFYAIFEYLLRRRIPRAQFSIFRMVLFAFLYTALDWAIPKIFTDTLGHAFYVSTYLRQCADLGGVFFLTFFILLTNIGLVESLEAWIAWKTLRMSHEKKHLFLQISILSAVWVALGVYGFFRYENILQQLARSKNSLQIAMIQPNIGELTKLAADHGMNEAAEYEVETLIRMSQTALEMHPRPQVLLWPETAFPGMFRMPTLASERRLGSRIENYVRQAKVPLLFGSYAELNGKRFNAFFYLSPNGSWEAYRKHSLLIFGEYIPGMKWFPWLESLFPEVGQFDVGPGPSVLKIPFLEDTQSVSTSPLICYEVLHSNDVLASVRQGSQLLINIANDSWYGPWPWAEPQLHLALSTFRAIENRLPLVRSTSTGISALILPTGDISSRTEFEKEAILSVYVPLLQVPPTWIQRLGDYFGCLACWIVCLGACLVYHPRFPNRA